MASAAVPAAGGATTVPAVAAPVDAAAGGEVTVGGGCMAGCGAGCGMAVAGLPEARGACATVEPAPMAAAEAAGRAEPPTAGTPREGVWGENGLGAVSRGSSAPHPRQNL